VVQIDFTCVQKCVVSHLIMSLEELVCSCLPLIGVLCAPQITGFQPSVHTAQLVGLAVYWSCIVSIEMPSVYSFIQQVTLLTPHLG